MLFGPVKKYHPAIGTQEDLARIANYIASKVGGSSVKGSCAAKEHLPREGGIKVYRARRPPGKKARSAANPANRQKNAERKGRINKIERSRYGNNVRRR